MILGVHIIKGDGDILYNATYDQGRRIEDNPIPSFVKACVSLLHAGDSTKIGSPYFLEQGGLLWAYAFFDSFVVVVSATHDEEKKSLGRIMLALGRTLAHTFGDVISSWSGSMGEIYEMHDLVAKYVLDDFEKKIEEFVPQLDDIIDRALEEHHVAYVGILDQSGNMLCGNIPEQHLTEIKEHLSHQMMKITSDLVPTSLKVKGYLVQLSRMGLYSVVAAGYNYSGRMSAVQAVDAIAESVRQALLSEEQTKE